MALPVPVFNLPVSRDMAILYHVSTCVRHSLLIWGPPWTSAVLLIFMSGLLPFSLVLNYFHWFNFVEKLAFPEVPILFLHDETRFIFFETFFELFNAVFEYFGPLCPLSTALASVKLPSFLLPLVPGSELESAHASSVQSELPFFLRHRRHCDCTL